MPEVRRVVVGVSGTPSSLQALRVGLDEARRGRVPLLAVLAWVPLGGEAAYRHAPCPPLLAQWEQAAAWRLRNAFDEALGGVPDDLAVELLLIRGPAGAALVDAADQEDDLLVVGSGPRELPARLFHGATARYCVSHAACRVLTVPPPNLLRSLPRRLRHHVPTPPTTPAPPDPTHTDETQPLT
ncbi:universal stress protein [Streptacidiphilus jiangxiensis]|uniref:Nucleotide-binding universal stress protein, UspA family n=1 Tax=Streptacidiphilus jiangxiensis TaxID=235985 RepID=A0A1H7WRR9_STRJI|nr:universal stress protein [Streptacidiphilus jiangxiensis]SEM23738.1 Nucleotide-binding universal stress protein, UspA family [Streptacidiphilus jiangxiensis]